MPVKIATCCPVWKEVRYLPLVLEQMALCPGPKLVLWQDQPLYWLGKGSAPSGFASKVGELVARFPEIEVVKMDHAPVETPDVPYGGFGSLAIWAFNEFKKRGIEVVLWMDSDWIYSIKSIKQLYETITSADKPSYWKVHARHFYRNFRTLMDNGDITVAWPIDQPDLWRAYNDAEMKTFETMCYHPAYVMTNKEMHDKVHSWGHAPLFKERNFYRKEWLGRDDSLVKPKSSDVVLPPDVKYRLRRWDCVLPEWW